MNTVPDMCAGIHADTPADVRSVEASIGLVETWGSRSDPWLTLFAPSDEHPNCAIKGVSRLYRTPPWGKTDQAISSIPALCWKHRFHTMALLDLCLSIERSMKRVRNERWGPRTIDIDVLTMAIAPSMLKALKCRIHA